MIRRPPRSPLFPYPTLFRSMGMTGELAPKASSSGPAALAAPTPVLVITAARRPVARAKPSAIAAAPCSVRAGTRRTPASRAMASKIGMLWTLMMPKAVSTPAAFRLSRTSSPPVRCTLDSLAGGQSLAAHSESPAAHAEPFHRFARPGECCRRACEACHGRSRAKRNLRVLSSGKFAQEAADGGIEGRGLFLVREVARFGDD